jgi:hypothetical protein
VRENVADQISLLGKQRKNVSAAVVRLSKWQRREGGEEGRREMVEERQGNRTERTTTKRVERRRRSQYSTTGSGLLENAKGARQGWGDDDEKCIDRTVVCVGRGKRRGKEGQRRGGDSSLRRK